MSLCSTRTLTVWLTGLPSAGKTTIGAELVKALNSLNLPAQLLDGDAIRAQSKEKLGFGREDREKNLRHIASLANELTTHGIIAIVASIAPYRELRNEFRESLPPFLEVFVNAPLNVCEQRDVKGLYRRFRSGEIRGLTGIDDLYEAPLLPDVECRTDLETVEESSGKILAKISLLGTIHANDNAANHQLQFNSTP